MDFYEVMEGVTWCGSGAVAPLWQRLGIQHGFEVKDAVSTRCYHVKQVHGVRLAEAVEPASLGHTLDPQVEADGIFTCQKSLPIAVKTADCLPILIHSPNMVMVLHAGWRSLAGGIIGRGMELFCERNVKKIELNMALGPCIGHGAFEVGPEVVETFKASPASLLPTELAWCLIKGKEDRWYFDLAMFAILAMMHHGIQPCQITAMRSCTFQNPELWHSYRRNGTSAGRIWSWISL